jgi:hypothetical protein
LHSGVTRMKPSSPAIFAAQACARSSWPVPTFDNDKEASAIIDGPVGKQLFDKLAAKGVVGTAFGFRHLHNSKHPINKMEDIQGLKLRVIRSPVYVDLAGALGANPVAMAFSEVYGAMGSKAIDGMTNTALITSSMKAYAEGVRSRRAACCLPDHRLAEAQVAVLPSCGPSAAQSRSAFRNSETSGGLLISGQFRRSSRPRGWRSRTAAPRPRTALATARVPNAVP